MIESEPLDARTAGESGKEIDRIVADLHAMRAAIVEAWRDSPVMLLRHERERLRDEIRATCEMLTSLTSG